MLRLSNVYIQNVQYLHESVHVYLRLIHFSKVLEAGKTGCEFSQEFLVFYNRANSHCSKDHILPRAKLMIR